MHVFIFLILFLPLNAYATEKPFSTTGLPLPRFVSLAKEEVNVRTGPGRKYPIKWVLAQKGLPVEIVLEYGNWRQVKDFEGQVGWVYHSLLSGRRTALVFSEMPVPLLENPENAVAKAFFSPSVIVSLSRCNDSYCLVEKNSYSGWIERKLLWGVYEHENID